MLTFYSKADGDNFSYIQDTEWTLVRIDEKELPLMDKMPSIMLSSINERITGYGGCNRIIGSFKIGKAGQIKFVNSLSTMRACETNMEVEMDFLKRLNDAATYKRENQFLYFLDDKGKEILRFKN